ncbi:hypothetical protein KIN20_035861 [Parelaphostrongylus tenuis]|uniref:Uncharacterized protein n=1 Tax=Parelaphostrongylus tenuis TaxID=148309 RepID=A0AAD5WKW6_PARTN|nr:hypothetical protein KIN20_035861 [Parelaphostrongylus tenuis]
MTSIRQTAVPLPINMYERSGDVESGRSASVAHAHVTGKLPSGCEHSSSSRVPPLSLQSTATVVSPRSRFIDGLKKRARLSSLNTPLPHGHEVLDMDIGFPPVCSPPPEVVAASNPDEDRRERFRRRTVSDAARTGLTFNGNGNNKRNSGVLVVFPSSSMAHSDSVHSAPPPTLGNHQSSSVLGAVGSKSFEGFLPATSRNGYNCGQSSPRHPLYVDTQLANTVGDKRRSPVASVVDFFRGRHCATSQSLTGLATPPSPTTTCLSARASASTDGGVPTSPLFSPVRGNSRLHLSRIYHPGMRSLDSGLDLSSPTIGHHALLIKEVPQCSFVPVSAHYLSLCLSRSLLKFIYLRSEIIPFSRPSRHYSIFAPLVAHKTVKACDDAVSSVFSTVAPLRCSHPFFSSLFNHTLFL